MQKWKMKKFSELSTRELYEIYKARIDIFVVEQKCAYPEIDELDPISLHLFSQNEEGSLVAYSRLIPEKNNFRIGRILITKNYRKQGLGKELFSKAIQTIECRFPNNKSIKIQAQAYLEGFYHSFGFFNQSEVYLEDNIPHIDMERFSKNEE